MIQMRMRLVISFLNVVRLDRLDSFTIQCIIILKGIILGSSDSFGYIDFNSLDSAQNAMKLDGTSFKGRSLHIDSDTGRPKGGYKFKKGYESKYNSDGPKKRIQKGGYGRDDNQLKNFKPNYTQKRYFEDYYAKPDNTGDKKQNFDVINDGDSD